MTVNIKAGPWARRYFVEGGLQTALPEGIQSELPGGGLRIALPGGASVSDALSSLPIPLDEIGLVSLNGKASPRGAPLSDGDTLEILPVIIGG